MADTYPGDIMLSTYEDDGSSRFDAITKEISPLTAYCLGLTDTCPELAQFPLLADMTPGVFSYGADGEARFCRGRRPRRPAEGSRPLPTRLRALAPEGRSHPC